MRRCATAERVFFGAAVLFWAQGGTTWVQAQYPVDQRVHLQLYRDTRPFDANPALRGGPFNIARPVSPLTSGNPFATGNVRGGLSLRSFSPITDPSTFRAPLGSAYLYTFRRDSVSVADTSAPLGFAGFGQVYYDRSRTTVSPELLQGRNLPLTGTFTRSDRDILDLRVDLSERARSAYVQSISTSPRQGLGVRSSLFGLEAPPRLPLPQVPESVTQWQRARAAELSAGTDRRFESDRDWRAALGTPLPEGQALTPLDELLRRTAGGATGLSTFGADVPPWAAAWRDGQLRPGLIPPPSATGEEGTRAGGPPRLRVPDPTILPGYEVFTDMRLALALRRDPKADWFKEMQQAARQRPDLAPSDEELARSATEFLDRMLNTPLETFAGQGPSAFNDQMLKAESLMEIGHYYEAADRYATASAMDPTNPLPLLGRGHALLAAGDYRSAAYALLAGLERFPEVARFALDLRALMGGGEQIDIRRADLLARLRERDSAELRFLLGYLEYHTGDRERGLENLERAARLDRGASVISRYPAMLRGEGVLPPPKLLPADFPSPGAVTPPPAPASEPVQPAIPPAERPESLVVPPPTSPE